MPSTDLPAWIGDCPGPEYLGAYGLGKVPEEALETIALHVAACPGCASKLHQVEAEDDLVRNLRQYGQGYTPRGGQGDEVTRLHYADSGAWPGDDGPGRFQRLPSRFGPYELLARLGEGGMATVFKARQLRPSRLVALKIPLRAPVPDAELFRRLRREGEAIARLQHENIVRLYEVGEQDGLPYFSMEYVDGESLAQRLAAGPLPVREAASIVRTLAGAVHCAHRQGVVHRDLKPANVLLGAEGVVKLTDFGLAKLLDADDGRTRSGAVLGTARYMAPEQASGDAKNVGPATDVYGLGAVLYELLTGTPPFRGATNEETLRRVRLQEPISPRVLRHDVPGDLAAVCLKCLEKDTGRRFASAEALADELGRWLRGEPTATRPPRWPARAWRSATKHPAHSLALVLTALVATAVPVLRVVRDPDRPAARIESALSRGEGRTLIPETGMPEWFRVLHGARASEVSLGPDGTVSVQSWDICLVELVRDLPPGRWRIRAQVRHRESKAPGEVGLFFLLREHTTPRGPLYSFGQLTFNDIESAADLLKKLPPGGSVPPRVPAENLVVLCPRLLAPGPDGATWDQRVPGRSARLFIPAGYKGGDWRMLTVEMTERGIRGTWGVGALVGDIPCDKWAEKTGGALDQVAGRVAPPGGIASPVSAEGGAFGLYVERGSASFRKVVVEPLTGEDSRRLEETSHGK